MLFWPFSSTTFFFSLKLWS